MGLHLRAGDEKAFTFYNQYFGQLVGAKITGFQFATDPDHDEEWGPPDFWPTFTIVLKNGEKFDVELSQDDEGNGPGMLLGLPFPQ